MGGRPGMVWVRGDDLVLARFLCAGRAAAVPRSRGAASPGDGAIAAQCGRVDRWLDLPGTVVLRRGLSALRARVARRTDDERARARPRRRRRTLWRRRQRR